ncbi:hypothetical protein [Azospirillum palustre]
MAQPRSCLKSPAWNIRRFSIVIPAKAGIQETPRPGGRNGWIPPSRE